MEYKISSEEGLSKYIGIGYTVHCVYCGNKMMDKGRYYDRDYFPQYYCECEYAKLEEGINDKIQRLKRELPKVNEKVVNDLKYAYEKEQIEEQFKRLKDKYGRQYE